MVKLIGTYLKKEVFSMETSEFLAKLIGFYLGIFGLLCLLRSHQIRIMAKDLVCSKCTLAVSGEISLLFGLVIVIDHSIWEYSWRGLITLLGYLFILRGILRFVFPDKLKKMVAKITESKLRLISIVMIVLGAYLTYCGFTK